MHTYDYLNLMEEKFIIKILPFLEHYTKKEKVKIVSLFLDYMKIVHHHLLFQAIVDIVPNSLNEEELKNMMLKLLNVLDMNVLIEPRLKLSHQRAWTGIMGIITSHIAFHYWIDEKYVQFDIYTCKKFDKKKAINFLKDFWKATEGKVIFINREMGKDFEIEKLDF